MGRYHRPTCTIPKCRKGAIIEFSETERLCFEHLAPYALHATLPPHTMLPPLWTKETRRQHYYTGRERDKAAKAEYDKQYRIENPVLARLRKKNENLQDRISRAVVVIKRLRERVANQDQELREAYRVIGKGQNEASGNGADVRAGLAPPQAR